MKLFEQRGEDGAVGMLTHRVGDLALERLDLRGEGLERLDERQHQRSTGGQLGLANASFGRAPELGQQLRRLLAPGVMLAGEERPKALPAQGTRDGRAGVVLQERERDRAVQIAEQPDRAGPEPLEL